MTAITVVIQLQLLMWHVPGPLSQLVNNSRQYGCRCAVRPMRKMLAGLLEKVLCHVANHCYSVLHSRTDRSVLRGIGAD